MQVENVVAAVGVQLVKTVAPANIVPSREVHVVYAKKSPQNPKRSIKGSRYESDNDTINVLYVICGESSGN